MKDNLKFLHKDNPTLFYLKIRLLYEKANTIEISENITGIENLSS